MTYVPRSLKFSQLDHQSWLLTFLYELGVIRDDLYNNVTFARLVSSVLSRMEEKGMELLLLLLSPGVCPQECVMHVTSTQHVFQNGEKVENYFSSASH